MNFATVQQIVAAGGFLAVECCGQVIGYSNPKPFTHEAAAQFELIRLRHVSVDDPFGNAWSDDSEAKALIADPAAHGAPADGDLLPFACPMCGAAFVWAGGVPRRVPKEVA